MQTHKSIRLAKISELVPFGASVADIGCDHGYLSMYLASSGKCKKIIATDVNELPLQKAIYNFSVYNLNQKIDTRLGNGLAPINKKEVDTVIIAGMGGELIASIIDYAKKDNKVFSKYILQPMSRPENLRKYLCENGFKITAEHLVEEKERLYTIIESEEGNENCCLCNYFLSKPLIKEDRKLFLRYIDKYIKIFNDIATQNSGYHETEQLLSTFISIKNKMMEEKHDEVQ